MITATFIMQCIRMDMRGGVSLTDVQVTGCSPASCVRCSSPLSVAGHWVSVNMLDRKLWPESTNVYTPCHVYEAVSLPAARAKHANTKRVPDTLGWGGDHRALPTWADINKTARSKHQQLESVGQSRQRGDWTFGKNTTRWTPRDV